MERKCGVRSKYLRYIENQKISTTSKKTLRKINKIFRDKKLQRLIDSNLFWLKVIKIIPTKTKEVVYDLEVKHPHFQNFIGEGGIILHNSGYSHDPITQKFLKENWEKHPEIFRKTWVSWKNHKDNKNQKKIDEF